jgi:hypothetical protein
VPVAEPVSENDKLETVLLSGPAVIGYAYPEENFNSFIQHENVNVLLFPALEGVRSKYAKSAELNRRLRSMR